MLFMGSEKYPDENSYEKFLAEVHFTFCLYLVLVFRARESSEILPSGLH
jgi:hypothetical protein